MSAAVEDLDHRIRSKGDRWVKPAHDGVLSLVSVGSFDLTATHQFLQLARDQHGIGFRQLTLIDPRWGSDSVLQRPDEERATKALLAGKNPTLSTIPKPVEEVDPSGAAAVALWRDSLHAVPLPALNKVLGSWLFGENAPLITYIVGHHTNPYYSEFLPYLRRSALIREGEQRGDILLAERWVDSTLDLGHLDEGTRLAIVEEIDHSGDEQRKRRLLDEASNGGKLTLDRHKLIVLDRATATDV